MNYKDKKEIYKAEVGTPLQKALVDNIEAQKQLEEVIDCYVKQALEEQRESFIKLISTGHNHRDEEGYWDCVAHSEGQECCIDKVLQIINEKIK